MKARHSIYWLAVALGVGSPRLSAAQSDAPQIVPRAQPGAATSAAVPKTIAGLLAFYAQGQHIGPIDGALVGLRVTNISTDGAVRQTRWGNGLLIRCDGFVLVPQGLFGKKVRVAGSMEDAGKQIVEVYLNPGTDLERRVTGRPPRYLPRDVDYAVIKVDGVHAPALRLLRPESLKTGDPALVAWTDWDDAARQFGPVRKATVKLGDRRKDAKKADTDRIALSEPVPMVPAGAAVVGPEGLGVGIVRGVATDAAVEEFATFERLWMATNCVNPLPTPDGSTTGASDMVSVPGGPVVLPGSIAAEEAEMAGGQVACVAPFRIDKYEVTNAQYLAFWQSDPSRVSMLPGAAGGLYPTSWSTTGNPFPPELSRHPVLGVSLAGAVAYARWVGKRLPTPYEWAAAAFGPKGEASPPDWVAQYVADRKDLWRNAVGMHTEYVRQHQELRGGQPMDKGGLASLPWIPRSGLYQYAGEWSKRTIDQLEDQLCTAWHDPLYVVPVGARDFDVSSAGVHDMLMNAYEIVLPPPPQPSGHLTYWLGSEWPIVPPARDDLFWPKVLEVMTDDQDLPLLSRLMWRKAIGPTDGNLLVLSNLGETISLLRPISGMRVAVGWTGTDDATTWPGGLPPGSSTMSVSGLSLWESLPRHLKLEMGRAVPINRVERFINADPPLHYCAPVGFRCAR